MRCRVCGLGEAEPLGKIADCGEFAGQHISSPIKGGRLWSCVDCDSMFRDPTLSESEYIALYEQAPSNVWEDSSAKRNDFEQIYTLLKDHSGGSILDIGCYTGNFLAKLPEKFTKFGIEPSDLAGRKAMSKNIKVLGKTLAELDRHKVFDVIVSIDVIEHVLDVERFLNQALAHLNDNGLLIFSTGNPDYYLWKKVFKSRFWYCFFAEHVTFPSYKYYKNFANRCGLEMPEQICFRYTKLKLIVQMRMLLRYSLFLTANKVRNIIRGTNAKPMHMLAYVSSIATFTDHHLIIFRKR